VKKALKNGIKSLKPEANAANLLSANQSVSFFPTGSSLKLHFYFHSFYAEILALNWENVRQRILICSQFIV